MEQSMRGRSCHPCRVPSKLSARSADCLQVEAVMTTGGNLHAKFVIHTVGPIYRDGERGEAEILANCHRESIRLADEHALTSVALPAISTGAYGYPPHEAAAIAITSTVEALRMAKNMVTCRFVLFDICHRSSVRRRGRRTSSYQPCSPFRIEKA